MNADDNRRIARNTIYLYIRTFVSMAVGLYTSRKILEALGVIDYGIFNIIGGVIVMMAFLSGSMNVAISRYLTVELGRKDLNAYNRVFNVSFLIQAGLALLVLVLAETIGLWFVNTHLVIPPERMSAANWVYQATVAGTVLSITTSPFGASIGAHERMHIYAYVGLCESFAKLLIVLSLFWCPWDRLSTWAIALIAVSLASTLFQVGYCRRQFAHCAITFRWDKSLFVSMASFSGWNLFGQIAWTLKDQGLNVVLNIFGGPVINAARGVAMQVRGAIMSLTGGFQSAVGPQLTKNFAANDIEATHRLLFKSSKFSFFLLLLPAIPVCFEINCLLGLWLVEVPANTTLFAILIIIEALCDVFSGPAINTLMATGKIKWYQIVVGSILLLNIPLSYMLLKIGLPIYVPLIVSIAFVIAGQISRLYFCRIQTRLPLGKYFTEVIVRCILVTLVALVVPSLICFIMSPSLIRLLTLTATSVAATSVIIWFIGLNCSERQFIKDIVSPKVQKLTRKLHLV